VSPHLNGQALNPAAGNLLVEERRRRKEVDASLDARQHVSPHPGAGSHPGRPLHLQRQRLIAAAPLMLRLDRARRPAEPDQVVAEDSVLDKVAEAEALAEVDQVAEEAVVVDLEVVQVKPCRRHRLLHLLRLSLR
jgi:hypothetical protein